MSQCIAVNIKLFVCTVEESHADHDGSGHRPEGPVGKHDPRPGGREQVGHALSLRKILTLFMKMAIFRHFFAFCNFLPFLMVYFAFLCNV